MFTALLITLRETLEAAIVIGIVLTFLAKTDQIFFRKYVWSGVGVGVSAAVLLALILELFFAGFQGATEKFFEGILMFITAGFITWMIMWVHRQKGVAQRIKEKVAEHVSKSYGLGISVLVAVAVWR
ncbi:MAG TPA: FTR1 family protein, partial [Candidatus Paceibacterota bacterium]